MSIYFSIYVNKPSALFFIYLYIYIFFELHLLHYMPIQCRDPNPATITIIFDFSIFFFILFHRLRIIRSGRQKCALIGNFKNFKKIDLLPADTRTQRQKKSFSIFSYLSSFYFNRINIIRLGRQKYGQIGKFQSLSKNGPTSDRYSYPESKQNIFDFSIFFFFLFNRLNYYPIGPTKI